MRRWPWLVVALTLAGDQATKLLVCASLDPADSLPLIPSVLHLTYVQNTGVAFGLWRGYSNVVVLGSVVIAAWVLMELLQRRDRRWPVPLGLSLILGGALGNLIDRVRVGYVIDFLDVRVWPVFNVADSAISVGVGLLLWSTLRRRRVYDVS
ncbi:MAG: signal peptidase II [Candidatus Omnitrophica bacterium]|nr:signal peptidase II [Candidatus Omnitrophota bacterium]